MLTPSTAWLIGVAVAAALGLYYARSRTWTCLIPAVMAASFISPTWFKVTLGGLPVGVASFVAALSIAAHLVIQRVTPRGRLGFDLTGVDVVVAAMVLWGGFVDLHHDRGLATSFLATYSEWVFPYLAGRLALSHPRALAQSCPAVVGFGSLVGIAAITQCLTGDNLFEWVCPRDSRVALNEAAYRFGLFERANATTRHPIFLGVILLTLLPWYVACIQTARSTTHRVLSWVLLVIWAMGIVSTLSRGPVLGLAVIPLIWALSSHRLLLLAAALLSTIAVGWVAMNPQSLIEMTARTVGDTRGEVVTLNNGERVIFTGTRARIVIWMVYGPLVLDGGATGYGTVASKGFPPRGIPGLPRDPATRQRLAIIDNSLLNVSLRYGLVGGGLWIACFAAAALTTLVHRPPRYFAAGEPSPINGRWFGATVGGVFVVLMTVYWDYDMAFWVLYLLGCCSAVGSQRRRHEKLALQSAAA